MTDIVRWLITVFFLSILLTWCLLNRAAVPFDWSPFHDPVTIPLLLVILISTLFGFLWGATIVWLNSLPEKSEHKKLQRTLDKLTKKLESSEETKITENSSGLLSRLLNPNK